MTTTFFGASSENVSNERVLLVVCFSFALSFVLYYTRSLLSKRVTKKPLPKCHSYKKRAHYSRDDTKHLLLRERDTRRFSFASSSPLSLLFFGRSLSLSLFLLLALCEVRRRRVSIGLSNWKRERALLEERERERERLFSRVVVVCFRVERRPNARRELQSHSSRSACCPERRCCGTGPRNTTTTSTTTDLMMVSRRKRKRC